MCRLLGVVATAPAPISELLEEHLSAFEALSENHCDGWGIASIQPDASIRLAKRPETALTSAEFHVEVGQVTETALLHLRKASVGMANTVGNTHPFVADGIALAHNGFSGPAAVLDSLVHEAGGRAAVGDTDSERYFELVRALLQAMRPEVALVEAASRIASRATVIALNTLLLTPDAMYCLYWCDEVESAGDPGGAEAYQMHFHSGSDRVLVASNGWDRAADRWTPLVNGQVLEIRRADLTVIVHPVVQDPSPRSVRG